MTIGVSRTSLFFIISSAIAACGDSGSTTSVASTDAGADSGSDAAVTPNDAGDVDACAPDGDGGCLPPSVRRPFLVGSQLRSAAATRRSDWMQKSALALPALPAIDSATRQFLAAAWEKDALEEHASIAAFARFSMYLLALGAPPDLVARSQRASLDEIVHARACFDLAARYSGASVGPSNLDLNGAMHAPDLELVAKLTAEEGCVGETLGAALAMDQLAVAEDRHVRAIMERVAVDEARHADLAWRFTAWAVKIGGKPIFDAIAQSVESAIAKTLAAEVRAYDGIDIAALHAHGRLTCEESRASAQHTIDEIVRPCLRRLDPSAKAAEDRALVVV